LIFMALLLTVISPPTFYTVRVEAQDIEMYIVNPLTGDNTFNISSYPIGSVFTVEFYVGEVVDMVTWQIHFTYNRTLINYAKTWFTDHNVFSQAIDQGAIPTEEVSLNVDDATDTADITIIMTCTYPPNNPQKHPVNVTSRGLLCKTNFTVASHLSSQQLMFISQPSDYPSPHVAPPYYLTGFTTSVDTLNGICLADGQPAAIYNVASIPEPSVFLVFIWIPMTLMLVLEKRRRTKSDNEN
jgi:hypothetical protein